MRRAVRAVMAEQFMLLDSHGFLQLMASGSQMLAEAVVRFWSGAHLLALFGLHRDTSAKATCLREGGWRWS
jgi:hypothetical protein